MGSHHAKETTNGIAKIGICGTRQSGKKTLVKNLLIQKSPSLFFKNLNYQKWKFLMKRSIVRGIIALIEYLEKSELEFVKVYEGLDEFRGMGEEALVEAFESYVDLIKAIWEDKSVKTVYDVAVIENEFNEGLAYYMGRINDIVGENYVIANEDVLTLMEEDEERFSELSLVINGVHFEFINIGDNEEEWQENLTDDFSAIIFISSMNNYDKFSSEDPEQNRLQVDIDLYHSLLEHPVVKNIGKILLLSKYDLFQKHIASTNIYPFFDGYVGGSDAELGKEFIQNLFLSEENKEDLLVFCTYADLSTIYDIEELYSAMENIFLVKILQTSGHHT